MPSRSFFTIFVATLAFAAVQAGPFLGKYHIVHSPKAECGHKCETYEDCTTESCPFCATGVNKCYSASGMCGVSCDGNSDCGGDCTVCSRAGYCQPSGNNGTCSVECGTDSDCRGDCAICSGDAHCHGESNVCLVECGTNHDCTDPCPVSSRAEGSSLCCGWLYCRHFCVVFTFPYLS